MSLAPGARVGPYELVERLGSGGMREVFEARDSRLNRSVALKFSRLEFTSRVEREARAIAALNHPNICTLHDIGPDYLVLELVDGETLAERIARPPVPVDEAIRITRQIADALHAAHSRGIIHRDLKPANIKIKPDGMVKVLDFGLARLVDPGHLLDPQRATGVLGPMTLPGEVIGTPAYMSPEQSVNGVASHHERSVIY